MIAFAIPPVYVLHVSLKNTTPLVWRRIKVRSDISLENLHEVIQVAMGWRNSHLHQFIVGKSFSGVPDPDDSGYGMEMLDEQEYTLKDLAPKKGSKLRYEYDFGDSWMHQIKVEQVVANDLDYKHPTCLAGENACPPEDVGGVWGYINMQEALRDPDHEEHDQFKEWIGRGTFDPTVFDLKKPNKGLQRIKG